MSNKDLQFIIDYALGFRIKEDLKQYIHELLNKGIFEDDFDVVIKPGDLSSDEVQLLINSLSRRSSIDLNMYSLLPELIDQNLCTNLPCSYIVKEPFILCTNGLRIAKFSVSEMLWRTPRISFDGIELSCVKNNIVHGTFNDLTEDGYPWNPIEIDFTNGNVIKGTIIED